MTTTRPTDPADPAERGTARRSTRVRRFVLGAVVATAAGGLAATAAVAATGGPSASPTSPTSPSASASATPGAPGTPGTDAPAPGCGSAGGPGAGPGGPAGPGRGDRVGPPAGGTVTAVDGDTLTLGTPRGGTRTVTLTADTVVVLDRGPGQDEESADRGAITVGQRVHVELTPSSTGEDRTAARVVVEPLRADGEVTAVDGTSLTVAGPEGRSTVVDVAGAEVLRDGQAAEASSIAVGEHVHAEAAAGTQVGDDGSFTATRVEVGRPTPPAPPAGAPAGVPTPGDGTAPAPGQDAPTSGS